VPIVATTPSAMSVVSAASAAAINGARFQAQTEDERWAVRV
jgi:hypothetical protein